MGCNMAGKERGYCLFVWIYLRIAMLHFTYGIATTYSTIACYYGLYSLVVHIFSQSFVAMAYG